jgi:hypothetical protein
VRFAQHAPHARSAKRATQTSRASDKPNRPLGVASLARSAFHVLFAPGRNGCAPVPLDSWRHPDEMESLPHERIAPAAKIGVAGSIDDGERDGGKVKKRRSRNRRSRDRSATACRSGSDRSCELGRTGVEPVPCARLKCATSLRIVHLYEIWIETET